ncbi:MAG: hypothetical protein ABSG33_10815 [Candidatus Bathyarchaeia archaeon]|jgi:hypothetical protein
MNLKQAALLLIVLLVSPFFVNSTLTAKAQTAQSSPGLYVGIDIAFGSMAQTEELIDNVSSYTNLIVIGCAQKIGNNNYGGGIYNETRLSVVSQYAYNKGLNFIVFSNDPSYPSKQWLENATENFGGHFIGLYYLDEQGGKQLDQANYTAVLSAKNFSDAASQYVTTINQWLRTAPYAITRNFDSPTEYPLFTSDYGLYWYDYAAGFNTVFAEFGVNAGYENYSRQLSMALCRGAATAFNENWGVMITDYTTQWPYMENGSELYSDMVLAYENGAKYIVLFDSNGNYTENVLQQDQLNAMKEFWQYTQDNPRTVSQPSDRSAYVLPADFGYGFRSPNDTIWGLWHPDWNGAASLTFVTDISMCIVTFLQMFGSNLDIIYPDGNQPVQPIGYQNVIYWNDTSIVPNMPPMPPQNPAKSTRQQLITPVLTGNSPLSYVTRVEIYAVAISSLVALAIAVAVLKVRRRQLRAAK